MRPRRLTALLCALLAFVVALPAAAQVRGISYTLSPTGEYLRFDGDSGLEDQFLYGGELGFGFGRLVELHAVYMFNNDLLTDYTDLSDISEMLSERLVELDERSVGLQRYGGMVKVNLATGPVVPYVQAGAGILRFSPEERNDSRTIYLAGGGGLQFAVDNRYTLRIGVQNLSYRYNLGSTFFDEEDLADAGLSPDNFQEATVSNWALRGALEFYLGGRDPDEVTDLDLALRDQLSGGLGGLSIPVEPFYGTIQFDDAFNFREDQRIAGVNAGLNLGPYVGVRGFYWRAVEEDETLAFDDLQAYGGEVKFRLGYGSNLTPYLLLGGGYLDVLDDYEGEDEALENPEDEPFAIGGVGAMLPLGDALRINASVRNLLMSTQGVDNLSDPNDVQSNWMYTAGVSLTLGGGMDATAGSIVDRRLQNVSERGERQRAELEDQVEMLRAQLDSLAFVQQREAQRLSLAERRAILRADSLRAVLAAGQRLTAEERRTLDELEARLEGEDRRAVRDERVREEAPRSNLSDRSINVPIPEEGEIYLRFGGTVADPAPGAYRVPTILPDGTVAVTQPGDTAAAARGGLTAEEVQRIVAETVSQQLRQAQVDGGEGLAAVEVQRLRAEIEALEERLEIRDDELDRLLLALDRQDAGGVTVVERDGEVVTTDGGGFVGGGIVGDRQLQAIYPLIGFRTGQGDEQFLIGLRGDYRSITGRGVRFVPELELGVGGGTSFALVGNAVSGFGDGLIVTGLEPYLGIGAGLVSESGFSGIGLALNLLVGAEYPVGDSAVFAEYSTLDLFDYSRFLFGYRFRF